MERILPVFGLFQFDFLYAFVLVPLAPASTCAFVLGGKVALSSIFVGMFSLKKNLMKHGETLRVHRFLKKKNGVDSKHLAYLVRKIKFAVENHMHLVFSLN